MDQTLGSAASARALIGAMVRAGFHAEVLCGSRIERIAWGVDVARELPGEHHPDPRTVLPSDSRTIERPAGGDSYLHLDHSGNEVGFHAEPVSHAARAGPTGRRADAQVVEAVFRAAAPDVLLCCDSGSIVTEALRVAGLADTPSVLLLHALPDRLGEAGTARLCVTSTRFAATYYREAFGLPCKVLARMVDVSRVRAERSEPRYVTFVNPSPGKGLYVFARIAEVLGRTRPDIPLLVVESRFGEEALASCGLDLRGAGNVSLMSHTADPREFWQLTRVLLVPSLCLENQPLVAVEALINGIPVIASDRGGLRETVGKGGLVLPLPVRLTPATRALPSTGDVLEWTDAVADLWDKSNLYSELSGAALSEAARWDPGELEAAYAGILSGASAERRATACKALGPRRAAVLVPHLNGLDPGCEEGLQRLERAGACVVRRQGSSQIDVARNQLASDALHDGFESVLFIDADIGFEAADALRLIARPEPVVAGVYAKKGDRELTQLSQEGNRGQCVQDLASHPIFPIMT